MEFIGAIMLELCELWRAKRKRFSYQDSETSRVALMLVNSSIKAPRNSNFTIFRNICFP